MRIDCFIYLCDSLLILCCQILNFLQTHTDILNKFLCKFGLPKLQLLNIFSLLW